MSVVIRALRSRGRRLLALRAESTTSVLETGRLARRCPGRERGDAMPARRRAVGRPAPESSGRLRAPEAFRRRPRAPRTRKLPRDGVPPPPGRKTGRGRRHRAIFTKKLDRDGVPEQFSCSNPTKTPSLDGFPTDPARGRRSWPSGASRAVERRRPAVVFTYRTFFSHGFAQQQVRGGSYSRVRRSRRPMRGRRTPNRPARRRATRKEP